MEKVVILARVSTDKQDYQRQIVELTDYCSKVGWEIVKVFANKISGAKKTEERPEVLEMLSYVKEHDIKRVCCLEVSRLGRNTLEALKVIQMLNDNKVSLFIKNYNLETLNPNGTPNPVASLITTILLEVASMERRTILERVNSGRNQYIAKCRKEGIKMGRPTDYKKSDEAYKEQYQKELTLLRKGISLRNVHKLTNTSMNTLRKLKSMFL
jgi:DNA invertase Pin-like site-specific DNA recombinase